MSTQHLHLAVNGKAQTKGHVVPGNCRFSLGIDVLRVLKTDAGLSSLILCVLGTVPVVSKRRTYLKMRMYGDRSWDSMPQSLRSRRDRSTFCSRNQERAVSTYSSSKKTIAVFDLHFSQLKSINVVSNVCKVKSFSSILMRMEDG